jgi:hypothetical protein
MADNNIKFQSGSYTPQTLVDYAANTLAPFTLLDCICEKDKETAGMNLIYEKMNTDIFNTSQNAESKISDNQYLLIWDNSDSNNAAGKFKVLAKNEGTGGSSAGDVATTVFGGDGQFHSRVKYADSLYNAGTVTPQSKYVPILSITGTGEQNTVYYEVPEQKAYNQALILNSSGAITWGAAGAMLSKANIDDNTTNYYLVANNTVYDNDTAPSKLYYDQRIYFRAGNLYHASDETLKTFTGNIDINLDNLATIKKGIFYWRSDPDKISNIGVSAQTVEALYPEIVTSTDGHLAVDYSKLSVIALAAIDKLHERITELEAQIETLKSSKN